MGEGHSLGWGVFDEWGDLDPLAHADRPGDIPADLETELAHDGGLMTVAEAAQMVGRSQVAVRHWIRRGQVLAVPHGRGWLVGQHSVWERELATRSTPGWDEQARARRAGGDRGDA